MKRIMIVGCCGAGKSTLSKQVHDITKLPLYHLDKIYWLPNWTEPEKEDFLEKAYEVNQKEEWIIDGNYSSSMEHRIQYADTIIFLDRSRWTCLWRVTKRVWSQYGKRRFDMADGCYERFDWKFMMYVFHFREVKRPKILKLIDTKGHNKTIYVCKTNQDVDRLLKTLKSQFIPQS